jgi:YHS domain-containing protein
MTFFRLTLILLLALVALTFIRMFAGILTKGIGSFFEQQKQPGGPSDPPKQAGGALKRDPVCGTFVAPETSIKATIGGEVLHFCSAECRGKYQNT